MSEYEDRLRAMIEPDQETWDLSTNDVKSIQYVLDEVARLTRERNALLVGMLTAHLAPHDHFVEGILAAPEKRAAAVRGTIENVVKVGYERYLDLPSDLGKTS